MREGRVTVPLVCFVCRDIGFCGRKVFVSARKVFCSILWNVSSIGWNVRSALWNGAYIAVKRPTGPAQRWLRLRSVVLTCNVLV